MLTPSLFIRQVRDLSEDKRRLGIPAEQPKQNAPQHLFEADEQPKPQQPPPQPQRPGGPRPPEQAMANLNLNGRANGGAPQQGAFQNLPNAQPVANSSAKLSKEKDKKRHHFGFGKKG